MVNRAPAHSIYPPAYATTCSAGRGYCSSRHVLYDSNCTDSVLTLWRLSDRMVAGTSTPKRPNTVTHECVVSEGRTDVGTQSPQRQALALCGNPAPLAYHFRLWSLAAAPTVSDSVRQYRENASTVLSPLLRGTLFSLGIITF